MYGYGYSIDVPEGSYQVFAKLYEPGESFSDMTDYRSYYSEFVTCGLEFDCPSHNPIVVEVAPNETVSDVDPQDWYAEI